MSFILKDIIKPFLFLCLEERATLLLAMLGVLRRVVKYSIFIPLQRVACKCEQA